MMTLLNVIGNERRRNEMSYNLAKFQLVQNGSLTRGYLDITHHRLRHSGQQQVGIRLVEVTIQTKHKKSNITVTWK
jgi:hypothetical protein